METVRIDNIEYDLKDIIMNFRIRPDPLRADFEYLSEQYSKRPFDSKLLHVIRKHNYCCNYLCRYELKVNLWMEQEVH